MLLKFESQGSLMENKSSWALSYDTIPELTWDLGGVAFLCRLCRLCWRSKRGVVALPHPSPVHHCSKHQESLNVVQTRFTLQCGCLHLLQTAFKSPFRKTLWGFLVNSEQLFWHETHESFILQMTSFVCLIYFLSVIIRFDICLWMRHQC